VGSLGVALGEPWDSLGVALGCLSLGYQHALGWLWGRIDVALSGFACHMRHGLHRLARTGNVPGVPGGNPMFRAIPWNPCLAAAPCFVQIRVICVWRRSGVGLGVIWRRPDVDRARHRYQATYEINILALSALILLVHRRCSSGAGPASPPCGLRKPLALKHL
jgi:hypothetical protein